MEDPSSPISGQVPDLVTGTAAVVTSKPIKKKAPIYSVEEDGSSDSPDEGTSNGAPFSPPSTREMELKAKRELIHFLENKQIDPKYAEMYQIHIRLQKQRKSSGGSSDSKSGYSVTYSGTDGSILTSKTDVLNSIMESRKRSQLSQSRAGGNTQYAHKRSEAHQQAKANLLEASSALPQSFDGLTVLNFGVLDTRSGFETLTQLYPIGYKCEQTVYTTNFFKGPSTTHVVCEVSELDGYPEFRVTVKNSGDTFLASTEAAVWKKFNPANVESDWQPSFFNLQVELLIEGMQGAETCDTYRFHTERGYGTQYFTQEEAVVAKNAFIAKSGREKRNLERQKARLLTKEEVDRLQELENKRLADEKELSKRLTLVEKERKDYEKDHLKRLKSEQKALDQQRREEERQEEARRREASKSYEKAHREQSKKSEKYRQQFKREVNSEVRKNRSEANSALLSYFDLEEEAVEARELGSSGGTAGVVSAVSSSSVGVGEFLATFADASVDGDVTNSTNGATTASTAAAPLDEVIQLTNTLHLFKRHLNIENSIKIDGVVSSIELASRGAELRQADRTAASAAATNVTSSGVVNSVSEGAMDVVESTADAAAVVKEEDEAEFEEAHTPMDIDATNSTTTAATATPTTLLASAEAFLDNIQLKLLHHLLHTLRDVLEIDDPNPENTKNKTATKNTPIKLPLNQLTFAELARMCILQYLYTEQGSDRENIQHYLRGAKAPHFKLAKNVIRNIRYRIAVRSKLPVINGGSAGGVVDGVVSGGVRDASGKLLGFVGTNVAPENHLAAIASINAARATNATAITAATTYDAATLSAYQARIVYQNNLFNTEREITLALEAVCNNNTGEYSEVYKRCARVLIRIINMAQSRNLTWEVDASLYNDYYTVIKRPVMYTGIAGALVNKSYTVLSDSSSATDSDSLVSALFSADMLQVPTNCMVYNSEVTPVVAQAQKMLHATHRLLSCWLHTTTTSVSMCSEVFCLLTQEYIVSAADSLKCGKCAGVYSYPATEDACTISTSKQYSVYSAYYIAPTQEIIDQQNEEWVCPLCLREDSTLLSALPGTTLSALHTSPYRIDEYGYSTRMPWMYHSAYSTMYGAIEDTMPYLLPYVSALRVLSNTSTSSVLPVAGGSTILTNIRSKHTATTNAANTSASTTANTTWSVQDRVTVLLALCNVFRSSDKSMEFMQSINSDCDKLVKLSAKPNFREADFMSVVKDLMGEEGVVQCRALLDGGNNSGSSSDYLQQVISEGRCVVCNHSTFEEDIQEKNNNRQSTGGAEDEEAPNDEVILCDGCNAEAHLRCLNLSAVPSSEWHCSACRERIAVRESKHSSVLVEGGGSIDKHRSKIVEDELINTVIDKRVSMVSASGAGPGKKSKENKEGKDENSGSSASLSAMEPAPGEDKCTYCGMGELEICSPFVVGQSREEHEAVLALAGRKPTADNFFEEPHNATGTTVLFLNQGKTLAPPAVEFPFFPPVKSPKGERLLAEHKECGGHCVPVIAHQLCALQIFQARVTRSRHTLRRRNKVVGQRAVSMTGISVLPLGYDEAGREYWKFPTSDDLFICITSTGSSGDSTNINSPYVDKCQAEFTALLAAERVVYEKTSNGEGSEGMDVDVDLAAPATTTTTSTTSAPPTKVWKRLSEVQDIRRVVELLGGSSEREVALKKNLINALLLERSVATTATGNSADATGDVKPEIKADPAAAADSTATDIKTDPATTAVTTMNSWLDRSRSSNSLENAKNSDSCKEEENKTLKKGVDIVPTSMRLMTAKGQDILPHYVIQNEVVFEEEVTAEDGGEDDEERVNEYFTFNKGRKYFAIALLNKEGSVLKMGGTTKLQNLTVVYQIHREGISAPLSYAPLSEAWTDHMYYFSTVQFKRSGRYTLSFIVEGDNAGLIKPLIFPVTVTSSSVRCGIPHAIDRLEGLGYLDSASRHVVTGRKEILGSVEGVVSEVDAVRAALLIVYLALPAGALSNDSGSSSAGAAGGDTFSMITEPSGWNDVLDQAWRGAVYSATTPLQIIECVLLLEYYINKQWLAYPHNRLLAALPNPHFAVCGATFSSAALRVYCLDKALLYDKVYVPPRERRATQFDQYAYEESATTTTSYGGRSTTTVTTSNTYERTKRTAATAATLRIQKTVNYNEGSDSDNAPPPTTLQPQRWACVECTVVNEPRARSCNSCGARKPIPGAVSSSTSGRDSRGANRGSGAGEGRSGRASGRAAAAESRAKSRRIVDSDNEDSDKSDDDEEEPSNENSDDDGDSDQGSNSDGSSEESESDNSLVNSDEDSPRPAKKRSSSGSAKDSTTASGRRTSSTTTTPSSERKSGRARNSVNYSNDDSEEEFDEPSKSKNNTASNSSSKRRREDSVDHGASASATTTPSNKRARELTPAEHSAIYRRNLPAAIANYTTLINTVTSSSTNADANARYLSILRALQKDMNTEPFWEPVDVKAVPSYKHYIKNPMDLGTVRDKVVRGVYSSSEEFAQDVRLVWSNCKTFNMEFSVFYNLANTLGKRFEELLQAWVLSDSRPANPDISE